MKGSCDIPEVTQPVATQVKTADQLPPEKLQAIKAYAAELHRKHPQMKQNRIMRKVAEKFKIKLV